MPTKTERVKRLTTIGLLPYVARELVDTEQALTIHEAALITPADLARAQAFALYSPTIPDHLREMLFALATT